MQVLQYMIRSLAGCFIEFHGYQKLLKSDSLFLGPPLLPRTCNKNVITIEHSLSISERTCAMTLCNKSQLL